MRDINWWIYKPSSWRESIGYTVNEGRCRHQVHADTGVGFYQCQRKPTRTIQGYGFCTQHAKMIERRMDDG